MNISATLASRSIQLLLFFSIKNTALVIAISQGVGIPVEALFAFESTCFIAVVTKNTAEGYFNMRSQTVISTNQTTRTPEF